MAIITESIPRQGFEIVQNRIGEILLTELTNQKVLQGFTSDFGVFLERQEPFDKSEDVMITVMLAGADYKGYTTKDSQGDTTYIIDVFASGAASSTLQPSLEARDKIFLYVGMIRYILSSGKYLTLGLPPGLIGGKYLESFKFDIDFSNFGNHSNYDARFIRFARMVFSVRIQENQDLWTGIPLLGNDTLVTLDATNKGFQLVFNN
jgi:hypothetical protein